MSKSKSPTQPARLQLTYRGPASLSGDPSNPRAHTPAQIAGIARSIETFGFNVPILIDGTETVIAGHGRLAAAIKLGMIEVPTVMAEHLSDAQRQAYMIADNRLTDLSRWDERMLGEVLRDLSVAELDFDLDAIGFSVGEIDFRIEALDKPSADDSADGPIEISGTPITREGDLWFLGRHRLLCGSALDPELWGRLMSGQLASVAFTDPPYNVKVHGHVSGLGKVRHREFAMASGEMDRDEFIEFLETAFRLMAKHSVPASIHFAAIDWKHVPEMITAGEAAFTELKNICVWQKPAGGMGALYRSQHELFFVWKSGSGRHRNNVDLGRHGRNRTNVWHYAGGNSFSGRTTDEGNLLALHPTVKPLQMVADAILDCTARGEIVLDPFLGSGSTLIAAERTGRRCFGMDIDPLYVDVAIRRWQRHSGGQAVHATTGRRFDDVGGRLKQPKKQLRT